MSGDSDAAVTEYIGRVLLRYFRRAVQADITAYNLNLQRDRDLLRLHWAISPVVRELTSYILRHRHETQSFLIFRERSDDGPVRGKLDARATLIRQMMSGHSAVTVSHEPVRSFRSGPNHVLVWVLQQAWLLSGRFLTILPADASYRALVEESTAALDQTRKIEVVRKAMSEVTLTRRPGSGALQEAARSRRTIYRLAHKAFVTLAAIEAGDLRAIELVLRETLLAPLEIWRRFELAVGLGVAEALAVALGEQLSINVLAGDSRTPIARVGRFAIFWQTRTDLYKAPPPEPSEILTQRVLNGYGMQPDSDRPDLIVVDQEVGQVVSVIEVKFFAAAGDDAWDRLRDAAHQVIRYSRGYRTLPDIDGLLGKSIIALVRRPQLPLLPENQPVVVDFADIKQGNLERWAQSIRPQ